MAAAPGRRCGLFPRVSYGMAGYLLTSGLPVGGEGAVRERAAGPARS
jgi:hypothetical protein